MLRERWLKSLCTLIALSFVLSGFPRTIKAQESGPNFYSATTGLEFDVSGLITSLWDSHANLEFVVTNTGSETIHNWHFTFDLPYTIEGIWGAQVFETGSGVYTII